MFFHWFIYLAVVYKNPQCLIKIISKISKFGKKGGIIIEQPNGGQNAENPHK